jgi:hypothetical protein
MGLVQCSPLLSFIPANPMLLSWIRSWWDIWLTTCDVVQFSLYTTTRRKFIRFCFGLPQHRDSRKPLITPRGLRNQGPWASRLTWKRRGPPPIA